MSSIIYEPLETKYIYGSFISSSDEDVPKQNYNIITKGFQGF